MRSINTSAPDHQSGFSLVELMVGLAIGLISTLVIMQVLTEFEGQKRRTSGSADAQTSGNIALYTIQRQMQMAGFGLPIFSAKNTPLKCDPSPIYGAVGIFPVTIIDGAVSDTIILRRGTTPMGGIPVDITSVGGNIVNVLNNFGCANGDIVVISMGNSCAMSKVASSPPVASSPGSITLETAPGIAGGSLACLGGWTETTYQVSNNNLLENGVAVMANIVNIQAQYGISAAANDNTVNAWVEPSAVTGWNNPSVANRNRIKAIRIAVVARNNLLEKEDVPGSIACSSETATNPSGICAWEGNNVSPAPHIDLGKNADNTANADWTKYRYRVFETIVPLRNMIWSGGATGVLQ